MYLSFDKKFVAPHDQQLYSFFWLLASESAKYSLELISSCEPDTEECMEYENHDEEDEPMLEELAPGVGRAVTCLISPTLFYVMLLLGVKITTAIMHL